MTDKKLVVAALLLTSLSKVAAAADTLEHQSPHAQKLLAALDSLGINDPNVQAFVSQIDEHVDHGYISLYQEKVVGGMIMVHYQLEEDKSDPLRTHGGGLSKMELRYVPDDFPIEGVARPDRLMLNYSLHF